MSKIKKIFEFIFRNIPIHIIQLVTSLLPNSRITNKIRGFLIRPFIGKCGKNFQIASGVIINKPGNLIIGKNVYIAHNVWINAVGKLFIDNNVVIGPMSVLATSKHVFENGKVTNKGISKPISIGEGTWIASHVIITDGVTIGKGALIAAGAVVTKDVEDNSLNAGVPAQKKYIKDDNK